MVFLRVYGEPARWCGSVTVLSPNQGRSVLSPFLSPLLSPLLSSLFFITIFYHLFYHGRLFLSPCFITVFIMVELFLTPYVLSPNTPGECRPVPSCQAVLCCQSHILYCQSFDFQENHWFQIRFEAYGPCFVDCQRTSCLAQCLNFLVVAWVRTMSRIGEDRALNVKNFQSPNY